MQRTQRRRGREPIFQNPNGDHTLMTSTNYDVVVYLDSGHIGPAYLPKTS